MISDAVETEERQAAYFEEARALFEHASASNAPRTVHLMLAERRLAFHFLGNTLYDLIMPALEHLQCDMDGKADCTIGLWDTASTGVDMLAPPCSRSRFTDRGDVWGFNSERIRMAFLYGEYSVNLFDMKTGMGLYWVPHTRAYPYWAKASPLRPLLHWCMERAGHHLLHAAAIGNENGAVLLTGKGGIGKSTTALRCLLDGMWYAGDDYVVVSNRPKPRVFPLYGTAKLDPDQAARFPELAPLQVHAPAEDEKAVYRIYPTYRASMPASMPLNAILIPRIEPGAATAFSDDISRNEVRHHASFTTVSQLPRAGRATYEFIHDLAEQLPTRRLILGPDQARLPSVLKELCDSPPAPHPASRPVPPARSAPLLSMIIPVYNRQHFIREAIENVLAQDYPELEMIIINDGSTDQTAAVVKNLPYDIRYYEQPNEGPAAARNRGILNATGDFIAFLDSDDLWTDGALELLTQALIQQPALMAAKGYSQIAKLNLVTNVYDYEGNPEETFPYSFPGSVFRAEAFNRVGLLDHELQFGEDTDWFRRAQEVNLDMKWLPISSVIIRRQHDSMTFGKDQTELGTIRVFKKALDRKRRSEQTGRQACTTSGFQETNNKR